MKPITPKSILVSLGILAAIGLGPVLAPEAHAFGLGGGTKADVDAEKSIRDLYLEFVKDWNVHDVTKLSARWSIDGDHVEPDGSRARGRDEVTAMLTRQHAGVFKDTTLVLTVKTVFMISDNVALVDGTYQLTGAVLPDGSAIPPRQGLLTSVLLKEKNTWSIFASRLMIPMQLPYKPKTAASPADAAAPKQP